MVLARHLTQPLGESVGVGGRLDAGPYRGRVEKAGAVLATCLQEVQGGAGVLADGPGGVGGGVPGIGNAREVEHGVAARHQVADPGVAGIDPVSGEAFRGSARGAARTGHGDDLVAALGEEGGAAPAEEARRPRDQELHRGER